MKFLFLDLISGESDSVGKNDSQELSFSEVPEMTVMNMFEYLLGLKGLVLEIELQREERCFEVYFCTLWLLYYIRESKQHFSFLNQINRVLPCLLLPKNESILRTYRNLSEK